MKKVFASHSEVCHVWAQFNQSEGKAGNIFFEGDKIYSYGYHYVMANKVTNKGKTVILTNSNGYSVSTTQHESHMNRALYGLGYTKIPVANPEASMLSSHKDNVQGLINKAVYAIGKAKRARKYKESYLNTAENNINNAKLYIEFFQIKSKLPKSLINAVYCDIEMVAERSEKAKAKERKRQEKQKQAKLKLEQEQNKEKLNEWLNGENINTYNLRCFGVVYLRIKEIDNKQRIETSLGATVGLLAAKKVWEVASKAKDAQTRIDTRFAVDHYTFEYVDKNGNVKIGCHCLNFVEMQRIANILGW